MKKNIIKSLAALMLVSTACDYNDDNFDGLDELAKPTDIKSLEYTITAEDYAAIAKYTAVLSEDVDELKKLASVKAFSSTEFASRYLVPFLEKKYPTSDIGSAIVLTYNQYATLPEYLSALYDAKTYNVSSKDYAAIWGEVKANYFTPKKPLSKYAANLLSTAYPDAEAGDVRVIAYNQSGTEPADAPIFDTEINETFSTVTANAAADVTGWKNIAVKGSGLWQGKLYNGNQYVQCSSYKLGAIESWFVSPCVSLEEAVEPKLAFDVCVGNYNADCFSVLISEDFDGNDVSTATWTDVTEHFAFEGPAKGYGTLQPAGVLDMSAYKSSPIYVAFRYIGDGDNNASTTYQVDNVQLGDVVDVAETEVYAEAFDESQFDNVTVQITKGDAKGAYAWTAKTYNGNSYAQASANKSTDEQVSYMVTPAIAVSSTEVAQLTFDICIGYYNADCLSVLISTDYTDNVDSATWNDVTANFNIPQVPTSGYGKLHPAGASTLDKYKGQTIYVAFKYDGNGDASDKRTTTYQIDNIKVKTLAHSANKSATLKSANATQYAVYKYSGSDWKAYNGVVALSASDYESMGVSYFATSDAATTYIDKYLAANHSYAQEDDVIAVMYLCGSANTYAADEYKYTSGAWVKTTTVETTSNQFVKNKDGWVLDPCVTIKLPVNKADAFVVGFYQSVVDWVWENIDVPNGATSKAAGVSYVTSYGNKEYYTGCSASYTNVDWRVSAAKVQYDKGYAGMTDEEIVEKMKEHFIDAVSKVLAVRYPKADLVEGIDVIYTINFVVYTGTSTDWTIAYRVVDKAKFEYIEDSFKPVE